MSDLISRQAVLSLAKDLTLEGGIKHRCVDATEIKELPSVQAEPTRIISETRAIPSDDDRVSLSEKVTATYYDKENEEWSRKIVTVRDVLDSVCDEYTVLPSAQPDNRLSKIAELVEGTIDHFDLDDAMDLLYQIKEVLK